MRAAVICVALPVAPVWANETARLESAAAAVQASHAAIPPADWIRARCVGAIPAVKGAAFAAGQYADGAVSCRAGDRWSAPLFVQLTNGSSGFQPGAQDVVLLVMNEEGAQKLLQNTMTVGAEIVAYSRTRGAFAETNLIGAVMRPDTAANASAYGAAASPRTVLASREISAPIEAQTFLQALNAHSSPSVADRAAVSDRTAPIDRASGGPPTQRSGAGPLTDDDVRTSAIELQQEIDRLLADATPGPVGTTGATGTGTVPAAMVAVDRARLLHLRRQLDALLAALNRR